MSLNIFFEKKNNKLHNLLSLQPVFTGVPWKTECISEFIYIIKVSLRGLHIQ